MAENKMLEMFDCIFGLHENDQFNVVGDNHSPYTVTKTGPVDSTGNYYEWLLTDMLNGTIEWRKLPWKPKKNEKYWYTDGYQSNTGVTQTHWLNTVTDYVNLYAGNVYRTREEAEAGRDELLVRLWMKELKK